jgi:N-acetylneuraminic acid mutarotase
VLFKWLKRGSTKAALWSNLVLFSPLINAFNESSSFPLMPEKVTNNAVTKVVINNEHYFLSFSGLGSIKTYQDVHNKSFSYDTKQQLWQKISPVPLSSSDLKSTNNLQGRLASVATSINDTAYIFGGYTVAEDHSEVSISDVYSYNLLTDKYTLLTPMPVPVDDSVALPFQQKHIYLVSGWHNSGNVNLVQLYNTQTNQWQQATPFPGKAVFGHAGGIVDNKMLICDGVAIKVHEKTRRTYQDEAACYLGIIDAKQPNKIDWQIIKHPTGNARYRMAAKGIPLEQKVVFVGGSDNPYNYNGIGYDGNPSQPSDEIWFFDLNSRQWQIQKSKTTTMDHRGLVLFKKELLTIGGMTANQQVLNSINVYPIKK